MKWKFEASVTVDADSEEAALAKISGRISAIARHLGNEAKLDDCEPFFKLTQTEKGTPADMAYDPIVISRQAAEQAEAEKAAARGEKITVGADDVGDAKKVLGDDL